MTNAKRIFTVLSSFLIATTSVHAFNKATNISAASVDASEASLSDLKISLMQVGSDPPSLEATIENTNPSMTYTILKWDTPLDVQALLTGVFNVVNLDTGEVVRGSSAKPRRIVPPPRKTLIELPPGESKVQNFVIAEPALSLKTIGQYEIRVRGTWKAVWPVIKKDVTAEDLEQGGRGERALSSEFESNSITVET